MKRRILYITPHLSTGGLPQYLLKKIETFNNDFEIWCIEWDDITGGVFVVQRNKLMEILGTRLITLHDKSFIMNLITSINPEVIHIEEIPETFISEEILEKIYDVNRTWKILVTTHSSHTNPKSIKFTSDRYVLVSEWSLNVFRSHFGDSQDLQIWEYPIEIKNLDKSESKRKLGFEEGWKHVINVGLFTPGKNQGEIFEVARLLTKYKIKFHFVGNQAGNFANYWSPLMSNKPENCIVHGEKSNIEEFLAASDAFYFTSNFELNPLAVKEALSFGLPTFIKKLHTYMNQYDGICNYIKGAPQEDIQLLLEILKPEIREEFRFNWGNTSEWFRKTIKKEIFEDRIYEKFFSVEKGDVVCDFGSSIGPFVKSIITKEPSHVYAFEPSTGLLETLRENIKADNVTIIDCGISNQDSDSVQNTNMFSYEEGSSIEMKSMRFKTFLEKYGIQKIDFLKTDCEGGEYDIFNDENFEWILQNVKKICGEWHLNPRFDPLSKEKFRKFRDTYLKVFTNYEVFSVDGVNIKWDLWNEHFIEFYQEVIIYINNSK